MVTLPTVNFVAMFPLFQWFKMIRPLIILVYAIYVTSQEKLKIKKEMYRKRLPQE